MSAVAAWWASLPDWLEQGIEMVGCVLVMLGLGSGTAFAIAWACTRGVEPVEPEG